MSKSRALWKAGISDSPDSPSIRHAAVRRGSSDSRLARRASSNTRTTSLRSRAKGYVQTRLEGRILVYSARVKPRTVIRQTVDDLVDRLFGGETLPFVQHLIEERGLSEQDLRQLRELLDRLDRKQGGRSWGGRSDSAAEGRGG